MNNFRTYLLYLLLLLPITLISQEVDCDNSVYISTHISTGSGLYRLQVDNGISNVEEIFVDNQQYRLGCLGYSVVDKMIYALEYNTYELLKINALGEITNLGIPKGLDTNLVYNSGDIFPGGRDFFLIGKEETANKDVAFYAIDIFDLRATPLALVSDGNVRVQDMARNPIDGTVYGYDAQQQKIITVSLGQVSNYQFPSISAYFTSLFFDKSGQLYGLGGSGPGTSREIFTIDKITGTATPLTDGPIGDDTDACSCPYTFEFYKKVYPKEVLPCQEVTIEYTFFNTSGSARTALKLLDELPAGLTITSIAFQSDSNKFNARINSGIGTNLVDLSRIEILLGRKNKITVRAEVDPGIQGRLSTQAVLENLPLALNSALLSDNMETSEVDDPNFIEVISVEVPIFEDQISYDCENETAIITAPLVNATSFLWDDGATAATLLVNQSGDYTVEMQTDCGIYRHTTTANFDIPERFVNLGIDRIEDIGNPFILDYTTNMTNIQAYEWQTNNPSQLSCLDCPTPTARLLEPTTLILTITDAQGCMVTDEVFIDLDISKNIYAPTIFSPNGDGINDFFYLQGKQANIVKFGIIDRWGNQVYQHLDGTVGNPQTGWDGRYRNSLAESGVFIWFAQVNYPDGTMEILHGTIALIR